MDGDYAAARSAPAGALGAGLRRGSTAYLDGALANPGIEPHHLLVLLRNPAVTAGLIRRIAKSPVWMKADRLRAAMALHPRTPRALVMALLPTLRWTDLLRVSATPQVAATVRSGATAILALRLPELAPGEKVSLARTAPAAIVPLLLRDAHPTVARAALGNPRTRWEDALALAERSETPPAVLAVAAENGRFLGRSEVRCAIAGHPRTPALVALRLVRGLDAADLERLLAREDLRPLVRVAVSRRLADLVSSGP
jgi:hypothetical protein